MTVDLTKLNFLSTLNYMKRYTEGSASLTLGAYGTTVTQTITHNLGYIPFFQVFVDQDNSGNVWSATKINQYTETSLSGVDPPDPALVTWATTTTLVINLINNTSPTATGTRTVWWVIYKDYSTL